MTSLLGYTLNIFIDYTAVFILESGAQLILNCCEHCVTRNTGGILVMLFHVDPVIIMGIYRGNELDLKQETRRAEWFAEGVTQGFYC